MGRKQSYRIVKCPRCRKRVRLWVDGRISVHMAIGGKHGESCCSLPILRMCPKCGTEYDNIDAAINCCH